MNSESKVPEQFRSIKFEMMLPDAEALLKGLNGLEWYLDREKKSNWFPRSLLPRLILHLDDKVAECKGIN